MASANNSYSIASYNLHGFSQGVFLLNVLCEEMKVDIILVQEHWLTPDQMYSLSIDPNYTVFGISAMESQVSKSIIKGRPYGGVATYIRNGLQSKCIECSERVNIIIIADIAIINVYLPYCALVVDRDVVVSILDSIAVSLRDQRYTRIILGADMNSDLRENSPTAKLIKERLLLMGVKPYIGRSSNWPIGSEEYTFIQETTGAKSYIDFFCLSCIDAASELIVLDDARNMSDHLPIIMNFTDESLSSNSLTCAEETKPRSSPIYKTFMNWDKSDTKKYYDATRLHLSVLLQKYKIFYDKRVHPLIESQITTTFIEQLYGQIVCSLHKAASETIHITRSRPGTRKFWWNADLKDTKSAAMISHAAWVAAGKPRVGDIFYQRNFDRQKYRKLIFKLKNESKSQISNKLKTALESADRNKFWRIWNANFKKVNTNVTVDQLTESKDVSNALAKNFETACNPNDVFKDKLFKDLYYAKQYKKDDTLCDQFISVEMVDKAIKCVKPKKAAGCDNISIEHILHAHPSVTMLLSILFNAILKLGYVPNNFGVGIIIPIPKGDNKSHNKTCNDFRGITLCPIISKIFEHTLLKLFKGSTTSVRQFGFKKGVGCSEVIHLLKQTVEFYNSNETTVCVGTIDLKKAFDKVNHFALLNRLLELDTPQNVTRVIHNWYRKSYSKVRWKDNYSNAFKLEAGVRQGGILSPLLFSIFVDILLKELEKSGLGSFVNNLCFNSFMYADDLIILSHTVTDLQTLMTLCSKIFADLDMPINVNKCSCIRIGPRAAILCAPVMLYGEPIPWVNNIKLLGVYICNARVFTCDRKQVKSNFYCCVNSILGRVPPSGDSTALLTLVMSKSIPKLLYGVDATSVSTSELKSLSHSYDSIFAKIFKTWNSNIIASCQYYTGHLPLEYKCAAIRFNFLNRCKSHLNVNLKEYLDTFYSKEVEKLCKLYNFNLGDSASIVKAKCWEHFKIRLGL